MKLLIIMLCLSACSEMSADLRDHLDAERDFHKYNPEYVADCLYYEEMVCEFEQIAD